MLSYFKIVMWGCVWMWIWIFTFPLIKKDKGNCLTWSVDQFEKKGGYLVIRWCRSNKLRWFSWPHFLWLGDEHADLLKHYIPKDRDYTEKKTIPKPWFDGKVKTGDKDDNEN